MVKANNKIARCVLACGILVSVVSLSIGAMSREEWDRNYYDCVEVSLGGPVKESKSNKNACQALINHSIEKGWGSLEQCSKDNCGLIGDFYYFAERYREAIPYFEKAISLGNNVGYGTLGATYYKLQDYYNAKKYYEMGCNKGNGDSAQSGSCFNLGNLYHKGQGVRQDYAKAAELYKKACDMKNGYACNNLGALYYKGQGVRQDYHKAHELWKKACDMKDGGACNNLGVLYDKGQGVRQNLSTAKQYYGKACDLGEQVGCDNYKKLNEQGI